MEKLRLEIGLLIILSIATPVTMHAGEQHGNGTAYRTLFPSGKIWWAKRVSNDLYTAGRLTETQIKYASEAGFKSVISLFNFSTSRAHGPTEMFPTTNMAEYIAKNLSGLYFDIVLNNVPPFNWNQVKTVYKLDAILKVAPTPVLFHCANSFGATFLALNYLAKKSLDMNSSMTFDSKALYEMASFMGYNFNGTSMKQTISNITGEPIVNSPTVPAIPIWLDSYWWPKPVYRNIFSAGQIWNVDLDKINATFNAMVNVRPMNVGPVTLLNIKENTGPDRQNETILLASRIDTAKPNAYVSENATQNYWSDNPLEFGDSLGYNATLEKMTVMSQTTLIYRQTPIAPVTFSKKYFDINFELWQNLTTETALLIHCREQYAGTLTALGIAAKLYNKTSEWALDTGKKLGFDFEKDQKIVIAFKEILGEVIPTTAPPSTTPMTTVTTQPAKTTKTTTKKPPSGTNGLLSNMSLIVMLMTSIIVF